MGDDLKARLSKIEDELNKVHEEMTGSTNFSVYKLLLINFKINCLCLMIDKILDNFLIQYEKKRKSLGIKSDICILVSALMLVLIVATPFKLIGLIGNILLCICRNPLKFLEESEKNNQEKIEIIDRINELAKRLNNYQETISLKIEKKDEVYKNNDFSDPNRIVIANDMIGYYMAENDISDVPDDIKELMLKILQNDFKTDNPNLYELLEQAKAKINDESLKKALSLEF